MLYILRLILVLLMTGIFSIIGFFWALCIPFSPKPLDTMMILLGKVCVIILGIDVRVEGKENFKNTTPSIIITNHISMIDIFISGCVDFPRPIITVGKKAILYYPLFGIFYYLTGNILIDRSKPKETIKKYTQAMHDALIRKKYYVWIFPEGKRSKGKGLLPFKKGAFKQAVEGQVPLIPYIMSDYYQSLNLNKRKSATIYVKILPSISTLGLNQDDLISLMDKTHKLFSDTLVDLNSRKVF